MINKVLNGCIDGNLCEAELREMNLFGSTCFGLVNWFEELTRTAKKRSMFKS